MSEEDAPLKSLLRRRGWTQTRLADETGILRTDINAIVNGRASLGAERRKKIAAALGVSVLELGAPVEEADEAGKTFLDLLAGLKTAVDGLEETVRLLEARLAVLEKRRGSGGSPRASTGP